VRPKSAVVTEHPDGHGEQHARIPFHERPERRRAAAQASLDEDDVFVVTCPE
jgi:hypothetical protein